MKSDIEELKSIVNELGDTLHRASLLIASIENEQGLKKEEKKKSEILQSKYVQRIMLNGKKKQ